MPSRARAAIATRRSRLAHLFARGLTHPDERRIYSLMQPVSRDRPNTVHVGKRDRLVVGPTSRRRARAMSPTRSTARRSPTTPTAPSRAARRGRTAGPTSSSISTPSIRSRSRRAARCSISRRREPPSTSSPSAEQTTSGARRGSSCSRRWAGTNTRKKPSSRGSDKQHAFHPGVRRGVGGPILKDRVFFGVRFRARTSP